MRENFHNSSGTNNSKKSRLKSLSLLDSCNFERLRIVTGERGKNGCTEKNKKT